jgi:hypothetical protein
MFFSYILFVVSLRASGLFDQFCHDQSRSSAKIKNLARTVLCYTSNIFFELRHPLPSRSSTAGRYAAVLPLPIPALPLAPQCHLPKGRDRANGVDHRLLSPMSGTNLAWL